MRELFRKIKAVGNFVWNLIIKNLGTIFIWGLLYYFFPTFTIVIMLLTGVPLLLVVLSALRAIQVYNNVILKPRITPREAYERRHEFANQYFKFNKLSRIIFISTIETEYNKETVTTKDNVMLAREVLGLTEVFNEKDVKKAWKDLLKENHPDLVQDHLKPQANKKTLEINAAKETLVTYLKDNGVFSKFNFK